MKSVFGISLTVGILLTVASCTAPLGTEFAGTTPAVTAPATVSAEPAQTLTAPVPAEPAPAGTAPTGTAPATTSTTPAPEAAPTAPASGGAAATEPPPSPGLQTFTFPDGRLSFAYPHGWSVRKPQEGAHLDRAHRASSMESAEVIVADGSGAEVARIMNGVYGDNAPHAVRRTVLDHAPVPGIPAPAGEPVEFGFALDEITGVDAYYFMDIRLAHEFLPAQENSGTNQVPVANGELAAYVLFDSQQQPVFATTELAKLWMASKQYAQLKALLLSLEYS